MGSYLTHPQTSTHSLGHSFAQQYKRDYGINNAVSTEDIIHVINDALHYKQLQNGVKYLLTEGAELNQMEFMSALEALLEETPSTQVVSAEESTIHELQHTIIHLREMLEEHEKEKSNYAETESQLYAAEHSISILEKENAQLQHQIEKHISLLKIMRQQTQTLEEKLTKLQPE